MRMLSFPLIVVFFMLVGVCSLAHATRVVPQDGVITLTDYGYRDWDPELVHYLVAPAFFRAGHCVLRDAAGAEVPCQIDGNVLSFVAGLPKGKQATFTLAPGKPDDKRSTLTLKRAGAVLEIGNEAYTLRLPAPGKKHFTTPAPAASVPGPLQGWKPAGGDWVGGSHFVTARQVSDYAMTLVTKGAACIEYEARYDFLPAGEYVFRVRVSPGIDRADITEEFDFNDITDGQDFLILELQQGFTPATFGTIVPTGEATGLGISRKPLDDYLAPKLKDGVNPPAPVGGTGATPMPPMPKPGMVLLEKIVAAGKWGGLIGGLELRGTAADEKTAPAQRVAVVPMHSGNWRRAMALTVWQEPQHRDRGGAADQCAPYHLV